MTTLVSGGRIETIVGARRDAELHLGRAVTAEERVYILHSAQCLAQVTDLRTCEHSVALDRGIQPNSWATMYDEPVLLTVSSSGRLIPDGMVRPELRFAKPRTDSELIQLVTHADCEQCSSRSPVRPEVLQRFHDLDVFLEQLTQCSCPDATVQWVIRSEKPLFGGDIDAEAQLASTTGAVEVWEYSVTEELAEDLGIYR